MPLNPAMLRRARLVACSLAVAGAVLGGPLPSVRAQGPSLGSFRWQLQPYCNVLTVEIVLQGTEYVVDGTDDQCGAPRAAAVVGRAFPNPDGSIGFGLSTVTTPGGTPVHLDATIAVATLSGTWRDSAGHTGTFAFTTGAGSSGAPRPVASLGLPPGSIPGNAFAPGSIGAAPLATGVVSAALQAIGVCGPGQYLRGTFADGVPMCTSLRPPTSTTITQYEGWNPTILIPQDGRPLIAHYDTISGANRLSRCIASDCSSGVTSEPLPGGYFSSVALGSDGLPVAAFAGPSDTTSVIHCGDLDCLSGNVTTTGLPGTAPLLIIGAAGRPVIASYRPSPRLVYLTFCGDVQCSAGNVTVEVPAIQQWALTLAPDGRVVVWAVPTFFFNSMVRVVCDATGCGAAAATAFTGLPRVVLNGSDGIPLWLEDSTQSLIVWRCDDLECWTATRSVAEASVSNYVGGNPSMAIGADGLPVISHWDYTAGTLRVTRCHRLDCGGINESTSVDDPPDVVGQTPSIAFGVDGFPIIAHRNVTAQRLRVTKCWSRTCQ